jgi:hypothetical protein
LFCKEQGLEPLLQLSLIHLSRHGFHGVAHDRSSPPGTARRARPTADPGTPFPNNGYAYAAAQVLVGKLAASPATD